MYALHGMCLCFCLLVCCSFFFLKQSNCSVLSHMPSITLTYYHTHPSWRTLRMEWHLQINTSDLNAFWLHSHHHDMKTMHVRDLPGLRWLFLAKTGGGSSWEDKGRFWGGVRAHVPQQDQINISLVLTHLFPQASSRVTIPIGLHRLEETRASVWPLIWRRCNGSAQHGAADRKWPTTMVASSKYCYEGERKRWILQCYL